MPADTGAMRSDTGMSADTGAATGTTSRDSGKANQTKSGVTNTETGKSTLGPGATQTRPDQNQPRHVEGRRPRFERAAQADLGRQLGISLEVVTLGTAASGQARMRRCFVRTPAQRSLSRSSSPAFTRGHSSARIE